MNKRLYAMPLALALVAGLASAKGSGTLYQDGKAIALVSAYAYRAPDPFDKSSEITTIVFADKPIDAAAANEASDRGEAVSDQLRRAQATRVELNLEKDGSVQNVNVLASGYSGSQSGSGWYTLQLRRNDARRIEGTFRSNDESGKKKGHFYDLAFALDIAGAPDPGAALPADGGEPGKAYRAYEAAMKKGDVDALARTMTHDRAAELNAHRNDADFKMMFAFIRENALRDGKIVKANSKGDRATLELSGKDGSGNAATSVVTLRKESGGWRIEKESMSSHVH